MISRCAKANTQAHRSGTAHMKNLLLATTLLAAVGATPAHAALNIAITANGQTFTCTDGEASCDQNGGANNLLTVDTTVGGAFVELTLSQSVKGNPNSLQLSSSNIVNESGAPITIGLTAMDTGFLAPVTFIRDSGSLTFNDAVGSGESSLSFFANSSLLERVFGTPLTNPDSFSGSNLAAFLANSPFSMTEQAQLQLISGGSITGFNASMTSGVPEPKTWAMVLVGFAFLGFAGYRRRINRLGEFA